MRMNPHEEKYISRYEAIKAIISKDTSDTRKIAELMSYMGSELADFMLRMEGVNKTLGDRFIIKIKQEALKASHEEGRDVGIAREEVEV